jgi:hypothetical protein
VTLLDGVVLARSAFHHAVNYRSVVVHGTAVVVEEPREKTAALAALVEAVAPGRTGGTRPPSRNELAATTVLRLDLHEVSVKVRTGPPDDDPEDLGLPYWAGVLPLVTGPGTPQPNDDLSDGVAVPEHVTAWRRPRTSVPRQLGKSDLTWVVDLACARRERIAPLAPRFWKPAPNARELHSAFLRSLIDSSEVVSIRTDQVFLRRTGRWHA